MWEHAGKPDGADFAPAARAELEAALRDGRTLADICAELKYTPKEPSSVSSIDKTIGSMSVSMSMDQVAPPSAAAAPEKRAAQPPAVGQSLGAPKRNPLAMIKVRHPCCCAVWWS